MRRLTDAERWEHEMLQQMARRYWPRDWDRVPNNDRRSQADCSGTITVAK